MAHDDLELLHNFIHDLKAPLSSAKSFIDLLTVSGELTKEQKHFAHRAQTNMDRMNNIINTLLEYARMEANDAPLKLVVCDLLEITDEVMASLESTAQERQITFNIDIQPAAQFVQADDYFLNSVMLNLMSNAIKYNKVGGKVFISSKDAGEFIEISIRDTGLGIPADAIDHVFERFYRVEKRAHQSINGTGIGLAMVQSIITKHGGEISVESIEDEGSTFTFTLLQASTSSPDYNREPTDGLADEFQEDQDQRDDYDSGEAPR
ncbi:MAG: HAMP domain-containing sensor histidine kinase [Phototrophicaceae bacterium]